MVEADPGSLDALVAGFQSVDAGFSSCILRSGSLCLRLPRSAAAAERWRGATRLLDVIDGHLAVELPTLDQRFDATPQHPHGGQLLRWLDGREADASIDPATIASFLGKLHGLDPGLASRLLPGFADWCHRQRNLEHEGLRVVQQHLDRALAGELRAMMTRIGDGIEAACRPCLVHGDLWYGNLLMRDGRLTGVLDWEFAAIADPMIDYAALWYLGDDFMARLLECLGQSIEDLPETIKYYRVLRELHGLTWSVDNDDAGELVESLAKVMEIARVVLA